ncbi:hypothetical protein Pfo_031108 [Paulownia fortunei]|nr:hypothetical protein Pfo_001804 [Paulownia fortunei]KAI3472315.1 hypothetical protein Pfo_031108 [Paulownia fortunei]
MEMKEWPPKCWCRRGTMAIQRAGPHSKNPNRYFYRCPYNLDHAKSFLWCDVYHEDDPDEIKPKFLKFEQEYNISHQDSSVPSSSRFTPISPQLHVTSQLEKYTFPHGMSESKQSQSTMSTPYIGHKGVDEGFPRDSETKMNLTGSILCCCCGCTILFITGLLVLILSLLIARMI